MMTFLRAVTERSFAKFDLRVCGGNPSFQLRALVVPLIIRAASIASFQDGLILTYMMSPLRLLETAQNHRICVLHEIFITI